MKKTSATLAAVAMLASISARAQLVSVDGGLAVQDSHGLTFANTIRLANVEPGPAGAFNWVTSLNEENYGGYSDWVLASANATYGPNSATNQLAQLFQVDCASAGACSSFTALTAALQNSAWALEDSFMSSSLYAGQAPGCGQPTYIQCQQSKSYYLYTVPLTGSGGTSGPIPFDTDPAITDAIAVREGPLVNAPELNGSNAAAALTLLLGAIAVMRGRRT
jgi:hypothetical protein